MKGKSYACRDRKENNLRPGDFYPTHIEKNRLYNFSNFFYCDGVNKRYKRISGIYKIENLITHKVYIGQSKDIYRRFIKHVNCKDMRYELYQDFNKYGINNFSFEVLKETKDLDYWEVFLIQLYRANNPKYGYNILIGGTCAEGENNNFFGKHHTEEAKRKNAAGHFYKKVQCIETGEIFKYINEIERKYNLSGTCISRCCRGLAKSCGGYHWKYYDETEKVTLKIKKPNRYHWLCKDPIKNDICYYYILNNRIRRHRAEYVNVKLGDCVIQKEGA